MLAVGRACGAGIPVKRTLASAVLAAAALLAAASAARAQTDSNDDGDVDFAVNYVYAAQLGFGGYSVGGLNVHLYSLPIGFTLQDVLADWNLHLSFPVQYGDYDVSARVDVDGGQADIKAKSHTLAIEPKAKLEIPVVREWWRVSLIGALGVVGTFSSSGSVRVLASGERSSIDVPETAFYTYQVGVSSLLSRKVVGDLRLSLGNAFIYAGNESFGSSPSVEAYGSLQTGVEARHPLGFTWRSLVPDASLFFIHYYFTPGLQFTRVQRESLRVDNLYEVGLTFGSETPLGIPLVGDMRIGAAYQVGEELDAFRLSFGFPF
jgi:hypothetical protein